MKTFVQTEESTQIISGVRNNHAYSRPKVLIAVMAAISIISVSVVMFSLYRSTIKEAELLLTDTAIGYSSLIESVYNFDQLYSQEFSGGAYLATLSKVIDAFLSLQRDKRHKGHSQEVILAKKDGDNVYFLFRQHAEKQLGGQSIPLSSGLAKPMRLALAGQSGTVIGLDYRNVEVLAAYVPLTGLGLGLVVKNDLSEIRAPFYDAAVIAVLITIFVIAAGALVFLRITTPLINDLTDKNMRLQLALDDLKEAESKLEHQATHDSLTGILNRRALMSAIEVELVRSRRYSQDLTLVMCDLDYFKRVNDTYGHPVGDLVLKSFAEQVENMLRSSDFFGRYGGEEFVILLPNTSKEEGFLLAERLRFEIASSKFDVMDGGLAVTVSIGMTMAGDQDESALALLNRADKALYLAKASGRNKVIKSR